MHEHLKHDGTLPIIGVNTFLQSKGGETVQKIELARSTEEEKQSQLTRWPISTSVMPTSHHKLAALQQAAINNENVFRN